MKKIGLIFFIALLLVVAGCETPERVIAPIEITQTFVSVKGTELALAQIIATQDAIEQVLTPHLTVTPTLTPTLPAMSATTEAVTQAPVCIHPYCTAPTFTLNTLEGEEISLEQYRGSVVLLNFWASWCSPCEEETPLLQNLSEKYKDERLVVIGVNQDESVEDIRTFIKKYSITYPILLDPGEKVSNEIYEIFSIPRTFFIDRNGVIRDIEQGLITASSAESKINDLLAGNLWATPTPVPDSTLTIINDSDKTICRVFVSLSAENDWGEDRLGSAILDPGNRKAVELVSGKYDIRLTDCDGNELYSGYEIMISGSYDFEFTGTP